MKIVITERQFKKLINENDDRKKLFEKFIKVYQDLVSKNKEITKNSTNKEIRIMQIALRIVTQKQIELNGILDENTQSTIKNFQSENNLEESGYFDLETIKKLTEKFLFENSISSDQEDSQMPKNSDIKLVGGFDGEQKRNIGLIINHMNKFGIKDPLAKIGILSVISKESGFKPKSELSYAGTSNSRIKSIFGSRVAKYSDSELTNLKKDPEKFFNVVYAKTAGNQGGDDGWKYRGRGLNQLTGRGNYEKYGNLIGKDLVGNPDLVNDPNVASEIAVVFLTKGKSGDSFPKFKDKKDAATYFADINAGGAVGFHRSKAVSDSDKFDLVSSVA